MPRSKTTLTDVSPSSGQLKSQYTLTEKLQLNALKQTSGSLGYGAGKISGSVASSFANNNRSTNSKFDLGGLIAENLFRAGHTTKTVASIMSRVQSTVDQKKSFHKTTAENISDLSIPKNRVPQAFRKTPNEIVRDKRKSLLGDSDIGYEGLSFPLDLTQKAFSYIKLSFYEYHRPSPTTAGTINAKPVFIYLPLPEDMVQDFSVRYNPQDIGGLRQVVNTETAQQIINAIRAGKSMDEIAQGLTTDQVMRDTTETVKNLAYRALSSTNIGGLVGQEVGMIPNPHPTVFFEGVDLRTFDWVWKLIPKSEREAEMIHRIIRTIKKECLPKKDGGYLTYPSMVLPSIQGNSDHVDSYKKCLINKINVNYNGEGTSAFFRNGRPVSILLTLGFQEAELYLEDLIKPEVT